MGGPGWIQCAVFDMETGRQCSGEKGDNWLVMLPKKNHADVPVCKQHSDFFYGEGPDPFLTRRETERQEPCGDCHAMCNACQEPERYDDHLCLDCRHDERQAKSPMPTDCYECAYLGQRCLQHETKKQVNNET